MEDRLKELLKKVPGSYSDFVNAVFRNMQVFPEGMEPMIKFLEEHPEARTDDVLDFEDQYVDYEMADEDDEEEP